MFYEGLYLYQKTGVNTARTLYCNVQRDIDGQGLRHEIPSPPKYGCYIIFAIMSFYSVYSG